jgi:hypothetical protein
MGEAAQAQATEIKGSLIPLAIRVKIRGKTYWITK